MIDTLYLQIVIVSFSEKIAVTSFKIEHPFMKLFIPVVERTDLYCKNDDRNHTKKHNKFHNYSPFCIIAFRSSILNDEAMTSRFLLIIL